MAEALRVGHTEKPCADAGHGTAASVPRRFCGEGFREGAVKKASPGGGPGEGGIGAELNREHSHAGAREQVK